MHLENFIKVILVISFLSFILARAFYFSPKENDEDILSKINLSLEKGDYAQVCGIYTKRYEQYEPALRGDSQFFELDKDGNHYKFLARHIELNKGLFYTSKSETRFDKIDFLKLGQTVCVTYSKKYLEVEPSYHYRQVPLLIEIN